MHCLSSFVEEAKGLRLCVARRKLMASNTNKNSNRKIEDMKAIAGEKYIEWDELAR